jgi:hypothetical protein
VAVAVLPRGEAAAQDTPVSRENALPGATDWGLSRAASGEQLEGYASATSVNRGEALRVHVRASGTHQVRWDLYRMGHYGGRGARKVASGGPFTATSQPTPARHATTGLVECRWPVSFTLQTDAAWVSGMYLLKLTRSDGPQTYVPFVLRDDARKGVALLQSSVNTWQAYNSWGGESLYSSSSGMRDGRAKEVSFNRPYASGNGAGEYFWNEHYLVRWVESRGYDVTYVTNVDLDRDPSLLQGQRLLVAMGHDEYWSRPMRVATEDALASGVSFASLTADSVYWQVRLEPSRADGAPRRTVVCWKEQAPELDPLGTTSLSTVRWRDVPVSQPENALKGVMYEAWQLADAPWVVAGADSWVYAGTGVVDGDTLPLLVGYESDRLFDNGAAPPGMQVLARSPVVDFHGGPSVHNAVVFDAPSGAFVFSSGTVQWSFGLGLEGVADVRVQRMTDNLFQRAGLQPATPGAPYGADAPPVADTSAAAGWVDTWAGQAFAEGWVDGPAAQARFRRPLAAARDAQGNVFVVDTGNHVVRMVANDAARTVRTIAGTGQPGRGTGPGLQAALNVPAGIAVGRDGSLFVSDAYNNRVVRIARDGQWTVSTWAGSASGSQGRTDAVGTSARFRHPSGLVAVGDALFVADTHNNRLRRIGPDRAVTTVVGAAGTGSTNGAGSSARLFRPTGLAATASELYVVDTGNRQVRRVALDGAYTTSTVAGVRSGGFRDGSATGARFMPLYGVASHGGRVLVTDTGNARVRAIASGQVSTWAGSGQVGGQDGPGPLARFSLPTGLVPLADGTVLVVDEGASTLRRVGSGSAPDAGTPDAGVPDAGVADAGVADAGVADAGALDAGVPDAGTRDAGTADAGASDAGAADAGTPDAGARDAGTADAGAPDAGTRDAGPADAGTVDGGTRDGGVADGGTADGGTRDGGTTDGGTADAGIRDGGAADAGSGPVAVITGGSFRGRAPLDVYLDCTRSYSPEPGGWIQDDATWDFGDGTTARWDWGNHVFTRPGLYTVTVTVLDHKGRPGTATRQVEVLP